MDPGMSNPIESTRIAAGGRSAVNRSGKQPGLASLALAVFMFLATVLLSGSGEIVAAIPPAQELTVSVRLAVPVQEVTVGERLTSLILRPRNVERSAVPAGSLRWERMATGESLFAAFPLEAGQPIPGWAVTQEEPSRGIAPSLAPGHRAVTVAVDRLSGVEGWLRPGHVVDLVLTLRGPDDARWRSVVPVERALVASVNRETAPQRERDGAESAAPGGPRRRPTPSGMGARAAGRSQAFAGTATLVLPARDAVKVLAARAMGSLSLVIRRAEDGRPVGGMTVEESAFGVRGRR
jgi:Flp pilus assembly protein CpaB